MYVWSALGLKASFESRRIMFITCAVSGDAWPIYHFTLYMTDSAISVV
jgi:hypothetical protein